MRSGRGSFSDLTPADVGGPVHADFLSGRPGLRSGVELLRGETISDFRGTAGFWGQGGVPLPEQPDPSTFSGSVILLFLFLIFFFVLDKSL